MGSAAAFAGAVALCPLAASPAPSVSQEAHAGTGREDGDRKAGSGLVHTAAPGVECATAPVQPLCQDVLSSGGKREGKGLGVGEPHAATAAGCRQTSLWDIEKCCWVKDYDRSAKSHLHDIAIHLL